MGRGGVAAASVGGSSVDGRPGRGVCRAARRGPSSSADAGFRSIVGRVAEKGARGVGEGGSGGCGGVARTRSMVGRAALGCGCGEHGVVPPVPAVGGRRGDGVDVAPTADDDSEAISVGSGGTGVPAERLRGGWGPAGGGTDGG